MADVLAWAGDEINARNWYHRARDYSSRHGDISMQNSVIYNSAAFRVSNLTLHLCEGRKETNEAQLAETEVNSALTLNALIGNQNNLELLPLLKAELLTALGDWQGAENLFFEYFGSTQNRNLVRYAPKLLAQRALCLAKLGHIDSARHQIELANSSSDSCKELDDLAVLNFRCMEVFHILHDAEKSTFHRDAHLFMLTEFRKIQQSALTSIAPVRQSFSSLVDSSAKNN
jgi:hypothetical protein